MAALFADVQLGATFVEGERERVTVDLPAVGLQGTALSEGLAARLAFVRTNTCNKGKAGCSVLYSTQPLLPTVSEPVWPSGKALGW